MTTPGQTATGITATGATPALEAGGLHKGFGALEVTHDVHLNLEVGARHALIGPNGAGKTTMMDCITGKTRPDEGTILFDGSLDLTELDEAAIASQGIGRKFQKPTVFENHTVRTNIALALKVPGTAQVTEVVLTW